MEEMTITSNLARPLAPLLAVLAVAAAVLMTGCASSASTNEDEPPSVDWRTLPVVPSIKGPLKERFLEDVARSRKFGMRPNVFAKVGDSNTEMSFAIYGLGCRSAKFGGRKGLQGVIDRFSSVRLANDRPLAGCEQGNSFSRHSSATLGGTPSTWSLLRVGDLPTGPIFTAPSDCLPDETPMSCEIRFTRPRYVLIMTGTNDWGWDRYKKRKPGSRTEGYTDRLIRAVRRLGSVPVVSTLPPLITDNAGPKAILPLNREIVASARKNEVPVINLWRALNRPSMTNSGMDDSGLHLRTVRGGTSPGVNPGSTTFQDSVDFRTGALRAGGNMRNLIWLKTLAALDRAAGVD